MLEISNLCLNVLTFRYVVECSSGDGGFSIYNVTWLSFPLVPGFNVFVKCPNSALRAQDCHDSPQSRWKIVGCDISDKSGGDGWGFLILLANESVILG